jgi:hypothetical protein
MNNFKLSFKLKQHTPLIHFQHDQTGATLRATELKPKLDKFLIKYFKDNNINYSNWLIQGQENALDYKVRIEPIGKIEELEIIKGRDYKLPNFFGNMGNDYESKFLNYSNQTIRLILKSFKPDLLNEINNKINYFFLTTNFGARQSKGFGSFTLEEVNVTQSSNFFDAYININEFNCHDFHITNRNKNNLYTGNWKKFINLFLYIETFYKNLRSGINRKGTNNITNIYLKPVIFFYAKDILNKQWDKKSIKEHYLPRELESQQITHNNSDILTFSDNDNPHILIKDVFGLSSLESWRSYKSSVSKHHNDIDRFKSPLLFKPIQTKNGYFIGIKSFDIDSDFLNQIFDIHFGNKTDLKLKTPNNFSWKSFWEYYSRSLPSIDERASSDNNIENQFEYCILSFFEENLNINIL